MSERPAAAAASRAGTLLLTTGLKIAGGVIAVNEAFTTKDAVVIVLAAFMMAGAQVSESLVLSVIDRFLGQEPKK